MNIGLPIEKEGYRPQGSIEISTPAQDKALPNGIIKGNRGAATIREIKLESVTGDRSSAQPLTGRARSVDNLQPAAIPLINRRLLFRKAGPPLGLYADGGGLYLQVVEKRSKSWIFRFMRHGRARSMGLGSLNRVSLAAARFRARERQTLLGQERDRLRTEQPLADAKSVTFSDCVAGYIQACGPTRGNLKHRDQWEATLKTYVEPYIGNLM